ncbi:MAG: heme exporter protein CcmD [Burkholderiaceae bacterium]|nr:heme exporter protein CcmD [Burkholderiaceae bacterium]
MSHWTVIAIAYGLTFLALAVEVGLLVRRRRAALRQVRLLAEATEPGGSEETNDPDNGNRAGT